MINKLFLPIILSGAVVLFLCLFIVCLFNLHNESQFDEEVARVSQIMKEHYSLSDADYINHLDSIFNIDATWKAMAAPDGSANHEELLLGGYQAIKAARELVADSTQ